LFNLKKAVKYGELRMTRTYHNKLVRNKIPDIIRQQGHHPECHIANDRTKYCQALREKILEEAIELKESQNINELQHPK
jgi:predicted house-cleaning noncanonical NTP pyrophosphatase (MazG superfamily)